MPSKSKKNSKNIETREKSKNNETGEKTKNKEDKPFRPTNKPRYLPGQVDHITINKDLKTFNQHRYNIRYAQTKVDSKPPQFHPLKYLDMIKIENGTSRLREIENENKELLKKINIINRNKGYTDTWNPLAYANSSKWRLREQDFKKIQRENKNLYHRLQHVKTQYSKEEHDNFYKKMESQMDRFRIFPHYKITTKDDELKKLPSISEGFTTLGNFTRPRVYMDFEIEEFHQKLGRIIIELYNDHCPKICENFQKLATGYQAEGSKETLTYLYCSIHKVIKDNYMVSGDVEHRDGKGGKCIYPEEYIKPENYNLKHSKPGVLSMVPVNNKITSQFSITFEEMPSLDGKQVVFGKVVKGAENLFKINDFGSKYGRPTMKLVIAKCGVKKPRQ